MFNRIYCILYKILIVKNYLFFKIIDLSITTAFPCRYSGKDKSAAAAVESEIARAMEWKHVTLVGWYHSHPRSHASPSLRDVDSQLDYQIKMKGPSDNGYTPCVGLICCMFFLYIYIIQNLYRIYIEFYN